MDKITNILEKNKKFLKNLDIYENLNTTTKEKLLKIFEQILYITFDVHHNKNIVDVKTEIDKIIALTKKYFIVKEYQSFLVDTLLYAYVYDMYYDLHNEYSNINVDLINVLVIGTLKNKVHVKNLMALVNRLDIINYVYVCIYYAKTMDISVKDFFDIASHILINIRNIKSEYTAFCDILSIFRSKNNIENDVIIEFIIKVILKNETRFENIKDYFGALNFGICELNKDSLSSYFYENIISGKYKIKSLLQFFINNDIPYEYFPDICKYRPNIIYELLTCKITATEVFYNDICDVFMINNKDDNTKILKLLIDCNYYVNKNTYHLALKSDNTECAKIIKKNMQSNKYIVPDDNLDSFSIPFIALGLTMSYKDDKITASKVGGLPYIDEKNKHLAKLDYRFVAQLNMNQIFYQLLENAHSDKIIDEYFKMYPKTGLIQIYSSGKYNDHITVFYIEKYNENLHLHSIAKKFTIDTNCDFNVTNIKEVAYITECVYGYDRVMKSDDHPSYMTGFEQLDPIYLSEFKYEKSDDKIMSLHIGGFPDFFQDGEFDSDIECFIFHMSDCSNYSMNIGIKQKDLKKCDFSNLNADISWD
jgi:hypothetical protein